jgi:hypothetical protein
VVFVQAARSSLYGGIQATSPAASRRFAALLMGFRAEPVASLLTQKLAGCGRMITMSAELGCSA